MTPWTWRRVPQADVVVFITAGAVDRSVAEATVGWMIALTHHFRIKDHLGAHRPMGRAIEVHGPRAARPDVWRRSDWEGSAGPPWACSAGSA